MAECPRQLFFEHYSYGEKGHANVWNLKRLRSIPAIAGEKVDLIVSHALDGLKKTGEMRSDLPDVGVRHYDRNLELSPRHVQQMHTGTWDRETKEARRFPPLQHDYYGYDVGQQFIDLYRERVRSCLTNFQSSDLLMKLIEIGPSNWVKLPTVECDVPSFNLDGIKVYAKFDFAFRDGESVVLLDWKSGHPSDFAVEQSERQLGVYGLYMSERHHVPLDRIKTQAIWLSQPCTFDPRPLSVGAVHAVKEQIAAENAAELSSLQYKKFPSGREEFWAAKDDFPTRPERNRCMHCNFRELCKEGESACDVPYSGENKENSRQEDTIQANM